MSTLCGTSPSSHKYCASQAMRSTLSASCGFRVQCSHVACVCGHLVCSGPGSTAPSPKSGSHCALWKMCKLVAPALSLLSGVSPTASVPVFVAHQPPRRLGAQQLRLTRGGALPSLCATLVRLVRVWFSSGCILSLVLDHFHCFLPPHLNRPFS